MRDKTWNILSVAISPLLVIVLLCAAPYIAIAKLFDIEFNAGPLRVRVDVDLFRD